MADLAWRKSSYSVAGAQCVEVAPAAGRVLVRDSKDPGGPVLRFSAAAWRAFTAAVRDGRAGPRPA